MNEEDIYSKLLDVTHKESPLVEEGRKKQHVERQIPPSMIIEIEKEDANKDVIIEVKTPYPDAGVKMVTKTSTISSKCYAH